MVEFTQATNEDILSIEPQWAQADPKDLELGFGAFRENRVPLEGTAFAARVDGKCIGAYGVLDLGNGLGHVWALFSEELLSDHWLSLARHAKADLSIADEMGLTRVQIATSTEHPKAAKFLEWLGFESKQFMAGYFPNGGDACLYERVCNVV